MFEFLLAGVQLLNRIVVTGILITAFALLIYLTLYNRRSPIVRSFMAMLCCVIGTYLFDLLAQLSTTDPFVWLRLQWLGIAFVPAASLDLSDRLLRATGESSPTRRLLVKGEYAVGALVFSLVMVTSLVATSGFEANLPHLNPGLLYLPFAFYYFASTLWAIYNVVEARRRALTTTSKRRLTYFAMAFAAPALAMFPYLLPAGWPDAFPTLIPWLVILLVNMAVGAAVTFMGYTVAYFGAASPDRIVKRRMIKFLLRGPLLAALVITAMVLSTRIERWLGLQGPALAVALAAAIILSAQLVVVTMQPWLDRLIAGDDADEVHRLQQFSERLMTTSDLTQYLENILAALCDLLRAREAFVTMHRACEDCEPSQVVTIGNVDSSQMVFLPDLVRSVPSVAPPQPIAAPDPSDDAGDEGDEPDSPLSNVFANLFGARTVTVKMLDPRDFIHWNGYWVIPLHAPDTGDTLGIIGLVARTAEPELTDDERRGVTVLVQQAERAIADSMKQQRAFEALGRIVPEADDMTRRLASTRNPAAPTLHDFEFEPQDRNQFTRQVRDALTQFWGGPRLTDSPLMALAVVEDSMRANNGNATKALRSVLTEAIERLRPDGQRSMTQAEWMLYNILELKIIQDLKVRDVARRLVMSESDLYRKQRAAFEEVARIMIDMERQARKNRSEPVAAVSSAPTLDTQPADTVGDEAQAA